MAAEAETPESTDDLSKPLGQKKPNRKRLVVPTFVVARARRLTAAGMSWR